MKTKEKQKIKTYTLDEVQDMFIGQRGTPEREAYELELAIDIMGKKIKELRKLRNLTQEELGKKLGVSKMQISKLEKHSNNASLETILKVFNALNVKLKFQFELEENNSNYALGA